jgi:hypothetical protein
MHKMHTGGEGISHVHFKKLWFKFSTFNIICQNELCMKSEPTTTTSTIRLLVFAMVKLFKGRSLHNDLLKFVHR